jgi:hypothetical protein
MPTKKYKPEQIVSLLRQIEVAVANGKSTPQGAAMPGSASRATTVGARSTAGSGSIRPSGLRSWRRRTSSSSAWWQNCRSRSRSLKRLPRETSKPRAAPGRSAACARKVPAE